MPPASFRADPLGWSVYAPKDITVKNRCQDFFKKNVALSHHLCYTPCRTRKGAVADGSQQ